MGTSEWASLFDAIGRLRATELNQLKFNPKLGSREKQVHFPLLSKFWSNMTVDASGDVNIYMVFRTKDLG